MSDVETRMDAVDQRFAPVAAPSNLSPSQGSRMLPNGDLVLADGRTLVLDGVSCSREGYESLARWFLAESASLVVVETGPVLSGKVPADVWVVEQVGSGSSTTFPVEAGIRTGWCDAKPSSTSRHNERFAALEVAFAAEREAYPRAAQQ